MLAQGVKPIQNALGTLKGITPLLIIREDLLHNIQLGILKNLMDWTKGFLHKHKGLEAFEKIWETIPPYPEYQPPRKQYQQVTMWSGTEMKGVNHVILACFLAAMHQSTDTPRLSAAAQWDSKLVIRYVHAIIDLCLMARYRSHTPETIGNMNDYLG